MGKLKPKVLVAQYDAVAIERIKAEWMQSPLWMKDYHVLLNGIQSLQNDNNMLRRKLLTEGEIGADASFKPRRLAAAEESIFDSLSDEEFEQWVDIMSRINWASLNAGDRRRLAEEGVLLVPGDDNGLQQLVGKNVYVINVDLNNKIHNWSGRVKGAYITDKPTLLIIVKGKQTSFPQEVTWSDGKWQYVKAGSFNNYRWNGEIRELDGLKREIRIEQV